MLLHLPHFVKDTPDHRWLKNGVLITRLLCNAGAAALLLFVDGWATLGWLLAAVSLGLHLLSFAVSRFYLPAPEIHPRLYVLAHLGLANFVLDTPGRGIPTVRLSHAVIVVLSVAATAALAVTWLTIQPMQVAWSCYDPAYITSFEDYRFGECDGGDICRRDEINCAHEATIFANEAHYVAQGVAVLFTVHLAAVPAKLDYYRARGALGGKKRR